MRQSRRTFEIQSDAVGRVTELEGAADFNSISGKATIFWGEEDGASGRYPPEYTEQLKQMRRLVKRVREQRVGKSAIGWQTGCAPRLRSALVTAPLKRSSFHTITNMAGIYRDV